jgi:predicted transcriptional regulator
MKFNIFTSKFSQPLDKTTLLKVDKLICAFFETAEKYNKSLRKAEDFKKTNHLAKTLAQTMNEIKEMGTSAMDQIFNRRNDNIETGILIASMLSEYKKDEAKKFLLQISNKESGWVKSRAEDGLIGRFGYKPSDFV